MRGYREVFDGFLLSREEYCLALYATTAGEVAVPWVPEQGARRRIFTKYCAMAEVVAMAARQALGFTTYVPVSTRQQAPAAAAVSLSVPDTDWGLVTRGLIRRAHTIALLLAPETQPADRPIGERLARQVEHVLQAGFQSRVIVVFPPFDRYDMSSQQSIHHQACVVLTLLKGGGRVVNGWVLDLDRYTVQALLELLPGTTLAARVKDTGGEDFWSVPPGYGNGLGRREVVATSTYVPCLVEAFKSVERELLEVSFLTRYP